MAAFGGANGIDALDAGTSIEMRQLGRTDLKEALAWRMEVLEDVFAEDEPWSRVTMREANAAFLEKHLGDGLVYGIASINGEDAGCGALCMQTELPSPDNPSATSAYLMNIYTCEPFRGQGVGHRVVSWLVAQARERGAGKIYLEATEAGCPVYESLGFRAMDGMMKLEGCDEV